MRTPQTSPATLLLSGLVAALVTLAGGSGGCWIALRRLRQRVDAHDDELDQVGRRVARREGQAGRELQLARTSKLDAEMAEILEASKGQRRRPGRANGHDGDGGMAWVNSMLGGPPPEGRE